MTSNINLEDLPQLVMDKITSLLNHKHLLALEQVSKKLKCAVDAHFSVTDHLIIGSLPEIKNEVSYDEATEVDKTILDGLFQIIMRCGTRLKTIHVTLIDPFRTAGGMLWNYSTYFKHFLASAEVSENCPNLENIIAFPNMDISMVYYRLFRQQKVLLDVADTIIYANNIKMSKGETCKLRSIEINHPETQEMEHILNLHSNIEQIAVNDSPENFLKFFPKFVENGLKDLFFFRPIDFENMKKYCNIGKDLRTLRFHVDESVNNSIADLNKLQLPKNVELRMHIRYFDHVDTLFAQLSQNICNYIIFCDIGPFTDCSLMTKLKNLQECWIRTSGQLKVIAEGSFPQLKRIRDGNSLCHDFRKCEENTCDLQIYLPQILTNKGNQLTLIWIACGSCISIDVVWKVLKYCTAAEIIEFDRLVINSTLSVTDEDVKVVCRLPNLQHFMFSVWKRKEDDNCSHLRELMERVVKEQLHFQFEHKYDDDHFYWLQLFSLQKINF